MGSSKMDRLGTNKKGQTTVTKKYYGESVIQTRRRIDKDDRHHEIDGRRVEQVSVLCK